MPSPNPPVTLNDILARYAALADDTGPVRHVRGVVLAVAEDWLIRLPAGKAKTAALDRLEEAAELACEALTG